MSRNWVFKLTKSTFFKKKKKKLLKSMPFHLGTLLLKATWDNLEGPTKTELKPRSSIAVAFNGERLNG